MSEGVVFVGGGGHASVLLDALGSAHHAAGYVAPVPSRLSELQIAYLGTDDDRHQLFRQGLRLAVLGLGGAANNNARTRVFEAWREAGFEFPALVHARATLSAAIVNGSGLQCMAGSVINAGARLGHNVIVNSNATVEHDCVLGDHVHVAPGATICAGVAIGAGAFVGAGSVIVPGIEIGAGAVIGAGSVVIRGVPAGARVAGVPAVAIETRRDERHS